MKTKSIVFLIIGAFVAGILFCGGMYLGTKKAKFLLQKVAAKLEQKLIANIPKATKPFFIAGFETAAELQKWEQSGAKLELSGEQASEGKFSGKITFQAISGAASVKLEKHLPKNLSNWSGYETFAFDVWNPSNKHQRLILALKDVSENRAKVNLNLVPGVTHIAIDIAGLWGTINLGHITQLNFMLWDNDAEKILYVDNLQLLPESALTKQQVNITSNEFLPKEGEKIYVSEDYFAFNSTPWQQTDFIQIPLRLNCVIPNNTLELPFSGGIPFPKGQLYSLENIQLADANGSLIPFQIKVLSKWPDKSIEWALLSMQSTATDPNGYSLRYGKAIKSQDNISKLTIQETADEISIATGLMQFKVSKRSFHLFGGDLILAHNGQEYRGSLDKDYSLNIEEQGNVRVCLKATGWFVSDKGEKYCRFVTRIYAYAGASYVTVQHTFIYTGYPENKYHFLYFGKNLPKNETIDAVYIKIPYTFLSTDTFRFAADNIIMQGDLANTTDLYQNKYDHFSVIKGNSVIGTGNKMNGWVDVNSAQSGVTIGVKNFWQQFPKGFLLDKAGQSITINLWPKQAGELDLKTTAASGGPDSDSRGSAFGLGKTHELFFYFHKGSYKESAAEDAGAFFTNDNLVQATPEWISATRVLGRVWPFDKQLGTSEDFLNGLFSWGQRQIVNFGWYGMINFGDTLSWYRNEDDDKEYDDWGWHPVGRWGWFNCEAYGTHTGALMQFLRTNDYKYFQFGANLARHIMDIDTCHYNTVANDPRLRNTIPDAYSQLGSMHRHNGNHWGGENDETSHANIYGLALYYYITGDQRAHDVINEIGSSFLKHQITYFGHPDIAPQRAISNILWGDINLYQLTGDEKYKQEADAWANLLYIGQKQNGSWSENYNPMRKSWEGKPGFAFMLRYTLPALIEYHKLTGNKGIAECIIKATDYMLGEDYSPYFDACAYSYWLTKDKKYSHRIKDRLDFIISRQQHSNDPLWDGMIYQKGYYLRVTEFLYTVPFAFEVLADEK